MRRRLTLLLAAGAALSTGCGGHSRPTAEPEEAISTFSVAPANVNASFAALNQLALRDPAGLRSAALARLSSVDPNVRYAAVYALMLTATKGASLDALVPILRSRDVSERILAAETLTAQRDKRGVPVLIQALDSTKPFAHWAPPRRAWKEAQHTLLRFVPEDLGLRRALSARAVAAAKPAWRRWWALHGGSVRLKQIRIGAP